MKKAMLVRLRLVCLRLTRPAPGRGMIRVAFGGAFGLRLDLPLAFVFGTCVWSAFVRLNE